MEVGGKSEFGFPDIPNHKAVLETGLCQHETLSQNDVLTVNHGVLTYHLRVLELKPSSSVSVLDTDIEVDIVGPESPREKTDLHVLIPLMFGKLESGVVDEGNYMYYKFAVDIDVWAVISSGGAEIEVKIDMDAQDGDTDLYISKHQHGLLMMWAQKFWYSAPRTRAWLKVLTILVYMGLREKQNTSCQYLLKIVATARWVSRRLQHPQHFWRLIQWSAGTAGTIYLLEP